MAIKQLNDEQVATWTRLQKDTWWYQNVYRGDMPQLTVRAALTGFLLGGLLSATALYIAGKTGITIGVGVTAVVLAFAIFRLLAQVRLAQDLTILENNCTQSIATAAGYMVTPLISGLAAYMLVTGKILPWWQMMIWNTIISVIGVLVAFPLKRRFINDEQLPFPEGRAAGVVLDALYTGQAAVGLVRARLSAGLAELVEIDLARIPLERNRHVVGPRHDLDGPDQRGSAPLGPGLEAVGARGEPLEGAPRFIGP